MFERLAVFDGGFTLDAVHAIAPDAGELAVVTRRLTHLVDASLVTVADGRHGRVRSVEQADDSPLWRTILAGDIVLARFYAGDVDRARDAVGLCS